MGMTVSTSAFDAVFVNTTDLLVWTVCGFVSPEHSGLQLVIVAADLQPEQYLDIPKATRWWDLDSLDEAFPMRLLADDVAVPMTFVGGSSGTDPQQERYESRLLFRFPTPLVDCVSLTLSLGMDMWPKPRVVHLDPEALRTDLARWHSLQIEVP